MQIKYAIVRTINTGDYENIRIEYSAEGPESSEAELIKKVEDFMENKEQEIREQIK